MQSFKVQWPNQYAYTDTNCANFFATVVFNQTCGGFDGTADDGDEYNTYEKWVGVSANAAPKALHFGVGVFTVLAISILQLL